MLTVLHCPMTSCILLSLYLLMYPGFLKQKNMKFKLIQSCTKNCLWYPVLGRSWSLKALHFQIVFTILFLSRKVHCCFPKPKPEAVHGCSLVSACVVVYFLWEASGSGINSCAISITSPCILPGWSIWVSQVSTESLIQCLFDMLCCICSEMLSLGIYGQC